MTPLPDPLERLRAVNPVPAPTEPDWARVREHVERALRAGASHELAIAVPARERLSRLRAARRGRHTALRLAGAVALCAALAVAALIAFAPSSGSPGFLARAAAALTPRADTVLYERWEHVIAAEQGNPVYDHRVSIGPEQLWIDGRFPQRYRAILEPDRGVGPGYGLAFAYGVNVGYVGRVDLAGGRNEVLDQLRRKLAGRPLELGGTLRSPSGRTQPGATLPTFTFVPPDELLRAKLSVTLGASLPGPHRGTIEDGADPVGVLRAAIAEGRAREAGSRRFDGRTVERIDFELPKDPPADAPPLPADAPKIHAEAPYAYVEPESFHPVEIVFGRDTYRFLAYEYLPASAANRALASVSAQHPSAQVTRHP